MPFEDRLDQASLEAAHDDLESSNWLIELANLIGQPIDYLMDKLPDRASDLVQSATTKAMMSALKATLLTLDAGKVAKPQLWWHRIAVTVSGGVGGAFGLPALPIELPISTAIMLRSIADVARAEGENLDLPEARLACIEVFALGGRSDADDASETGYFAVRASLGRSVSEAAAYIVEKGAVEEGSPVILRLIQEIARRFAPVVAEKVVAQGPVIVGAAGGATVNLLFINHFQRVAQGHFAVRRLERKYGGELVQRQYEEISERKSRDRETQK